MSLRGLAPLRQVGQAVEAHEEVKLAARRQLRGDDRDQVDGVVRTGPVDVARGRARNAGLPAMASSVIRTRSSTGVTAWPCLERLLAGGRKEHLVEPQLVARLFGEDQVADVRRIEAAAEQADAQALCARAASPPIPVPCRRCGRCRPPRRPRSSSASVMPSAFRMRWNRITAS